MSRQEILRRAEGVAPTLRQHAIDVDTSGAFPRASIDALRDAGLLGVGQPSEVGGLGGTIGDCALAVERVARECGSSAMVYTMHLSGAQVIQAHGSAPMRRRVASGEALSTLAFSEAGSRSHFWAPVSTATRENGHIRLDARKSWCTSADHADHYVWSSGPARRVLFFRAL